jgi:hypothetical protein
MQDLSYDEALERSGGALPHEVLLGPVPCGRCQAWVEWAGVGWLSLGTTEPHDCWPYLAGQLTDPRLHQAHPMDELERRAAGLPALQPVPAPVPRWVDRSETAVVLALLVVLVVAMIAALLPPVPR